MKRLLCLFLLIGFTFPLSAQDESQPEEFTGTANAGFGFGLDYGGIGARLGYAPIKNFGIFAGLGYNLDGLGYNLGAQLRFPGEKKVDFHLTGMYGYNAVLIITGDIEDKETYYGVSVGAGVELKTRGNTFWNFELLVPFRDSEFDDDVDALELLGAEVNEPLPIAISIGYHIKF